MGGAFEANFGAVRLHTDTEASHVSRSIQAKAFTYGSDIYFAKGAYAPSTPAGEHLLAHELAHVTQPDSSGQPTIGRADDPAEAHADRIADSVLHTLRQQAGRGGAQEIRREATREVSNALRRQVASPDAGGAQTTAPGNQFANVGATVNPAVVTKTVAPPSRDGDQELPLNEGQRPDPVAGRSASDQGVIRRFFGVVDKSEPVKTYGKVGGAEFEWIEGERDKTLWELSPIPTNWWMRKLYQRVKTVEVAKGGDEGLGETPGNGLGVGGLGADDKEVVLHLRAELESNKNVDEDPASKVKTEQVKDLIAQSKKLDGNPDLAAETIVKLDVAAIAGASSRNSVAKGGASSKGGKVPDMSAVEAKPFKVPSSEQDNFATEWALKRDDAKFVFAMSSQANLDYFSGLTMDQRTYLSKTKMKKHEVPTQDDIEKLKERVKKFEAEEAAKAEEKRLAVAATAAIAKKRDEGEKEWATRKSELREAVRMRVEAEMPDYKWEAEFDNLIGATDVRITMNASINISKQINGTTKDANAALDAEKKRRDIAAIEKKYPDLASSAMSAAKEEVLKTNSRLTPVDFESQVKSALTLQRNPTTETWARLLEVKLYQSGKSVPFERLTELLGYQTHYSVDLDGMTLPVVTDTTTPVELLDALFGVVDKSYRLHVTLETGVEAGADELKLPHGYWNPRSAKPMYELRFDGGKLRWDDSVHTENDIKGALKAAYVEIRNRLVQRATVVLGHDCHPRYLP